MINKVIIISFILLSFRSVNAQTWSNVGGGVHPANAYFSYSWGNNLIVHGEFTSAGSVTTNVGIVYWNGTQWRAMDSMMNKNAIRAFCEYNGELYLGGSPMFGPGTQVPILRWNGQHFENTMNVTRNNSNGEIRAMVVFNNELYVAGKLQRIGGIWANHIARWNGSQWQDVGGGVNGLLPEINAMKIFKGKLIIAGGFTSAGGVPAFNIAAWDGLQWSDLDTGVDGGWVSNMINDENNLYIMGGFTMAGGTDSNSIRGLRGLAKWDGTNWQDMPGREIMPNPRSMAIYKGDFYYSGASQNQSVNDTVLVRWNGVQWERIPATNGTIQNLNVFNGQLILSGPFDQIGTDNYSGIASYYAVGNGINKYKNDCLIANYPNPFTARTNISYCVPSFSTSLSLVVSDIMGRKLKEYPLDQSADTIEIDLSELDKGMYLYSLLINGQIRDTKRMMVIR